jgi:hypothetical protein
MSSIGGPNTVNSDLLLSYDISNIKSFRGEPTVNAVPFPSGGVARYNNPGFSGTIVNTGQTYKGSPIWEATFIPQAASFISRLASTEGFGFFHSMGTALLANTPYIASVYFKTDFPLASTSTRGFANTYSNISGWGSSGTSTTRYEEDGWTRLWSRYLNNLTIGGVNYSFRGNSTQNTVTVNTTETTDLIVTINLLANATITATTNVNTSGAAGFSDVATLVGFYAAAPTIISTTITGMSTGTATIINHGTDTTAWTKISTANPLPRSSFPTQYYVQIRVPSTSGANQTFVLRPNFSGYYTAISDGKYWKVTFNTAGLQVGQVIRTYWAAPMIEQRSIVFPSNFVIGTRGSTAAAGGGILDRSGNGNNGDIINNPIYNSGDLGSLVFDGVDDRIDTTITNFGNNTTWSAWVNRISSATSYNMFMGRTLPYFGIMSNDEIIFSNTISGSQRTVYSQLTSPNNKWYNLSFTTEFDGTNTTMRIYVNGQLTSEASWAGSQSASDGVFAIGDGRSTAAWYPFNGRVAGVQIYNRTLSADEILQNYNAVKLRYQ